MITHPRDDRPASRSPRPELQSSSCILQTQLQELLHVLGSSSRLAERCLEFERAVVLPFSHPPLPESTRWYLGTFLKEDERSLQIACFSHGIVAGHRKWKTPLWRSTPATTTFTFAFTTTLITGKPVWVGGGCVLACATSKQGGRAYRAPDPRQRTRLSHDVPFVCVRHADPRHDSRNDREQRSDENVLG